MKVLFLTSNPASAPLMAWLKEHTQLIPWESALTLKQLDDLHPDLIISYSYGHILKAELLASRPHKFINLHISLLPYNRGADPHLWSFLENTPKGVSIHRIDAGIDTGPVLAQKEVTFDERNETLSHSYQTLQEQIQLLFRHHWDSLCEGSLRAVPQTGEGTFHYVREFAAIKDRLLGKEGWDVPVLVFQDRYRRLKDSGQ